jgi:hypothetical protein
MTPILGGCRCGAVRYTLLLPALPRTYACHCLDCQTWTGSAFSQQMFVPEPAFRATGPLTDYTFTTPSGNTSRQRICGICHARIYNSNTARPGVVVVRAGTLDQSDRLDAVAHIWIKRKQSWLVLPHRVPSWPESAPLDALLEALAPPPMGPAVVD